MAHRLTNKQLAAIHAKGNNGISSKSLKKPTPTRSSIKPMKFNNVARISQIEVREWEKTAGSKLVSAKVGKFDGREIIDVEFQNGDKWFEFDKFRDQDSFFEKNDFKKDTPVGKFIEVNHPKIAGYVTMITRKTLLKEKEDSV